MAAPLPERIPLVYLAISVLWPSFITAIVACGIFFSAFNPRDLIPFDLDVEFSPLAAYSIGFFIFWLLAFLSSLGTLYFTVTNCRFIDKQGN
jgi:hypothetical protein